MIPEDWLSRTELLLGADKIEKLKNKQVLISGLGGVGAMAAEMICRSGVGNMTIVDSDTIHSSNLNRQIPALISTLGKSKVETVSRRLLDINPGLNLTGIQEYLNDDTIPDVLEHSAFDYVIDAIDTLGPKTFLISHCLKRDIKIISSMGSGGKLDPAQVQIADIEDSYNCKLAYYLRKKLHKIGINTGFKVVFSPEIIPREAIRLSEGELNKKSMVGTISYMPVIFACFCVSVVLRELLEEGQL
jgi:tRNA threonylcarbamoyladenosine dehydratase